MSLTTLSTRPLEEVLALDFCRKYGTVETVEDRRRYHRQKIPDNFHRCRRLGPTLVMGNDGRPRVDDVGLRGSTQWTGRLSGAESYSFLWRSVYQEQTDMRKALETLLRSLLFPAWHEEYSAKSGQCSFGLDAPSS